MARTPRVLPKSLHIPHSRGSLGTLPILTPFSGPSSPLEGVPEDSIIDSYTPIGITPLSSTPNITSLQNGGDGTIPERQKKSIELQSLERAIVGLFSSKDKMLSPGELTALHENVRFLLSSQAGSFIMDYYKKQLLARGMAILKERLAQERGERFLPSLVNTWDTFFTGILPILDAIFYSVKAKAGSLNIRQTSLVAFRDLVLLKFDIEGLINNAIETGCRIHPKITHMLLVLQLVNDSYPPNKQKLRLESVLARLVVPFLGFNGLYEGGSEPVVRSNEPAIAERRRSSAEIAFGRRVSRPLTVQPKQMETLNQLFRTAVRKQQESS